MFVWPAMDRGPRLSRGQRAAGFEPSRESGAPRCGPAPAPGGVLEARWYFRRGHLRAAQRAEGRADPTDGRDRERRDTSHTAAPRSGGQRTSISKYVGPRRYATLAPTSRRARRGSWPKSRRRDAGTRHGACPGRAECLSFAESPKPCWEPERASLDRLSIRYSRPVRATMGGLRKLPIGFLGDPLA